MRIVLLSAALALSILPAHAQQASVDAKVVDQYVAGTFKGASNEWKQRIEPDETSRVCSAMALNLPQAEFDKILAREKATVKLPADGNVIGDWKAGQRIAQSGRGGQFSDEPGTVSGGNCYACHQLSKGEVSFGTLGPTLLEYGKIRKFDKKEAEAAYAKVYNAQAVQPCSNMPRFGHNKVLSEQQMKDVVAYLFDPASPVNK